MMFQTRNGWTVQSMIDRIMLRNNGTRSVNGGSCAYRAPDGNNCGVGCFIPIECDLEARLPTPLSRCNSSPAIPFDSPQNIKGMLVTFPELEEHMPLESEGLWALQQVHDAHDAHGAAPTDDGVNVREAMCEFVRECVVDDPSLAGQPAGRVTVAELSALLVPSF